MTGGGAPKLDHLLHLLDDTGIAQHATYAVVAREHGYCLDDNARGLTLAASFGRLGWHPAETPRLFARTAAFTAHAWNAPAGRFRNFMGFDRQWMEPVGSEDSHGRAVWALGTVLRDGPDEDARRWAGELFDRAAPALPEFTSPRALACGLLGLEAASGRSDRSELRDWLAGRLCEHLRDNRTADWVWFEASLSYDNARLAEGLLAAGQWAERADWVAAGLATLQWLCRAQTGVSGCFSPVGSARCWQRDGRRARFDQQPIEASGLLSAALRAWRITGDRAWLAHAERALAWFTGRNDLGVALAVPETGACRDGLHPDRANANQGAESTLAWLQAQADMAAARADQITPSSGWASKGSPNSRYSPSIS